MLTSKLPHLTAFNYSSAYHGHHVFTFDLLAQQSHHKVFTFISGTLSLYLSCNWSIINFFHHFCIVKSLENFKIHYFFASKELSSCIYHKEKNTEAQYVMNSLSSRLYYSGTEQVYINYFQKEEEMTYLR